MQHANSYRRNLQISEIYHFVVLGYPTIGTGEQYLEVDMSRSDAWLLGLNHGPHAAPQLCSMNEMFPNVKFHDTDIQHETYQSKYGYWIIGMKYRSVYAFDKCPVTYNSVSWPSLCLVLSVMLEFSCPGKLGLSHFMMFLPMKLSSIGSMTLPSLIRSTHILILLNVQCQ